MKLIACVILLRHIVLRHIVLRHIDKDETSFWVIKCHVNSTRNEIIRKETSGHAFISSKQE